jgi:thiol-disulfide isomerase/thioredoxin
MFKIKAPELRGIKAWINSDELKIEDLRDKVVLLDFWTYTCTNCQRTIPYLNKWYKKYKNKDFIIIGVHSPEFEFEKNVENVRNAVKKMKIKYPVAVDSNLSSWNAFENRYWPAKYIIVDGFVEYVHFGEGNCESTEKALQHFLGLEKRTEKQKFKGVMPDQSPETYAGFEKNEGLGSGLVKDKKGNDIWVRPKELSPNVIYPEGRWEQERRYLELKKAPGKLTYLFNAREVNVVIEPVGKKVEADVFVDYKKKKTIKITAPDNYRVFKSPKYAYRELGIIFRGKARVYCLTFD